MTLTAFLPAAAALGQPGGVACGCHLGAAVSAPAFSFQPVLLLWWSQTWVEHQVSLHPAGAFYNVFQR